MRGVFITVIVVFFVIVGATQAAYVVSERQLGLVLQFGKPIRTVTEPGLYFKYPFVQDVTIFDKRILPSDAPPQTFITLDKKRLIVDTVSRWRIIDPLTFFRTVRDYRSAQNRLNDIISSRLRQEIANEFFTDFITEKREDIMEEVSKGSSLAAKPFGIEVIDVRIKRVDLPQEVQASVFARMKAERERIAKRYRAEGNEKARKIRANADKEKEILLAEAYRKAQASIGEGDAEAAAIYAKAYGENQEFYSFSKHLDVYEKVFGPDTTILLRPDSPLLRFLDTPGSEYQSVEADK